MTAMVNIYCVEHGDMSVSIRLQLGSAGGTGETPLLVARRDLLDRRRGLVMAPWRLDESATFCFEVRRSRGATCRCVLEFYITAFPHRGMVEGI